MDRLQIHKTFSICCLHSHRISEKSSITQSFFLFIMYHIPYYMDKSHAGVACTLKEADNLIIISQLHTFALICSK